MTENMKTMDEVTKHMSNEQRRLFAFALLGALSVTTAPEIWTRCLISAAQVSASHMQKEVW